MELKTGFPILLLLIGVSHVHCKAQTGKIIGIGTICFLGNYNYGVGNEDDYENCVINCYIKHANINYIDKKLQCATTITIAINSV